MKDNQADEKTLARYTDALLRESAHLFETLSVPVSCVYIGGGTPTVLSAPLLDRLLSGLRTRVPATAGAEWTVEAGRPDSIDRGKLQVLYDHGVGRVCINPQTMHDRTLERIGRCHTTEQTVKAFEAARTVGFPVLNMDLIAGLPGESRDDFIRSHEQVRALGPENITIHTLAVKRKSRWAEQMRTGGTSGIGSVHEPDGETAVMVAFADRDLHEKGWLPYYLYRQKDAVGGLENTGYARPGTECRYNVAIMGDRRSVIGIGCGAMSKMVTGSRVERVPTVRNPELYMSRAEEAAERILSVWNSRDDRQTSGKDRKAE